MFLPTWETGPTITQALWRYVQQLPANLPITYKLLVNGFVSMTGGQAIEGELSIDQIVSELDGGVRKMALVSDEPEKFSDHEFPNSLTVHERTQLEVVQRDFRDYNNVSVIIYEQPCATERRRLRKEDSGTIPINAYSYTQRSARDAGTAEPFLIAWQSSLWKLNSDENAK